MSTNKEQKVFEKKGIYVIDKIERDIPKKRKFKYTHDDKYFTIHLFSERFNKWEECYYFEKHRCKTTLQQFDWLYQVGDKTWMDEKYKFMKAFDNALKEWSKEDTIEYR